MASRAAVTQGIPVSGRESSMGASSASAREAAREPGKPHEAFLARLGARVRTARAQRGMTRRDLSRESGVSERYLAQLESGQGNISVGLLRQIAQAMSVSLADLVHEGPERSAEFVLLGQFLARLDDRQITEAAQLLRQHFGENGERLGRIALIGLRGAGKSTLGRMLAERLSVPYVELAREIERDAGLSLNEVFALSGQATFRRLEQRALERIVKENREAIISTGGGIVSSPAAYESLLASCFTVWLRAKPEDHMQRVIAQGDQRPMAGNREAMEDLKRILRSRENLYSKADAKLWTSDTPVDESFHALLEIVERARGERPRRQ